jgi:hypothetical protein
MRNFKMIIFHSNFIFLKYVGSTLRVFNERVTWSVHYEPQVSAVVNRVSNDNYMRVEYDTFSRTFLFLVINNLHKLSNWSQL